MLWKLKWAIENYSVLLSSEISIRSITEKKKSHFICTPSYPQYSLWAFTMFMKSDIENIHVEESEPQRILSHTIKIYLKSLLIWGGKRSKKISSSCCTWIFFFLLLAMEIHSVCTRFSVLFPCGTPNCSSLSTTLCPLTLNLWTNVYTIFFFFLLLPFFSVFTFLFSFIETTWRILIKTLCVYISIVLYLSWIFFFLYLLVTKITRQKVKLSSVLQPELIIFWLLL